MSGDRAGIAGVVRGGGGGLEIRAACRVEDLYGGTVSILGSEARYK